MEWLANALVAVLRWQIANPGAVAAYDDPRVPPAGSRIWGMFLALHGTRGAGFSGPLPIGLDQIEAYARLSREPVRPFECDIIRAMDAAYLETAAQKRSEDKPAEVSSRPMSPALFDAVFA